MKVVKTKELAKIEFFNALDNYQNALKVKDGIIPAYIRLYEAKDRVPKFYSGFVVKAFQDVCR